MRRYVLSATLLAFSLTAFAQTPTAPPLLTHQVNPDSTITFRYVNKGATKVTVSIDAPDSGLVMTRDDAGIWSVTTKKLAPNFYGYAFIVDGATTLDPGNPDTRPDHNFLADNVMVPGETPQPWELTAIPHGRVDHHMFTTHIAKNLPQNQSPYVVYTPPGYDPKHKGGYPVLYLLHGWDNNQDEWTQVGHANLILDSLIAQNKAVPMIVVMPLGYGNLDFVSKGYSVWRDPAGIAENTTLYSKELLTEIMPAIDAEYNVAKGRENRAIVGLSMGGLESLSIGLANTDKFAYVGGMSSAVTAAKPEALLPSDAAKANLKLLWVACGVDDALIKPNREFVAYAKSKGFAVTPVETPGRHIWPVWRDNLITFAPLLFRK